MLFHAIYGLVKPPGKTGYGDFIECELHGHEGPGGVKTLYFSRKFLRAA